MPTGVESVTGRAGFVLTGGNSTRMGRDKALLPYRGATLIQHIAAQVRLAAGSVVLVGPPERYEHLGMPVIGDRLPGLGPLSGIQAALASSEARWNLIVACDMPALDAGFLASLLDAAERSNAPCLLPVSDSGLPEPLCAVYRNDCLETIGRALAAGVRKVTDALAGLPPVLYRTGDPARFQNANTPEDWGLV